MPKRNQLPKSSSSSIPETIIQGLGQGFVDSLNFAAFFSYCLRSRALLDLALFAFMMNGFVLLSFTGMEWLFGGSGGGSNVFSAVTQVAWQIPMKLVVDVFGVGGWTLYNRMYSAAFVEAKNRNTGNLGAAPEKVRHRVSVGEKINRSATLTAVTLYKPILLLWLAACPTVIPASILNWIFPAEPISKAVSYICIGLLHLAVFIVDTMSYSFFCFEPRMSTIVNGGRVLPLSDQLKWIEYQWPYFVGYGLCQFLVNFALINVAGKSIVANAIYSALMPIQVVTSLGAISDPGPTIVDLPLPLFSFTCKLWSKPVQSLVAKKVGILWATNNNNNAQSVQHQQQTTNSNNTQTFSNTVLLEERKNEKGEVSDLIVEEEIFE